jgi:AP-2 complex subunit alpha
VFLLAGRSREAEEKRINKELGHIRQKFKEGNMSGYDRKKYVAKLLYMHILGYRIEFGHVEAINLISSPKYKEKQIGYLAVTLLFNETADTMHLVVNSFKKDLDSENELISCLVLSTIANVGGTLFAETLGPDVIRKLTTEHSSSQVRKKAALCLLKLYRKSPASFNVEDWSEKVVDLIGHSEAGVSLSVLGLLYEIVKPNPEQYLFSISKAIERLEKIVLKKDVHPNEIYCKLHAPWLQVQLLRHLRLFTPKPCDSILIRRVQTIIQAIVSNAHETPKNLQQANAAHAVLFEAIYLLLQWNPTHEPIAQELSKILSKFLTSKDANARYLTLEAYVCMLNEPVYMKAIQQQEESIVASCQDKDVSVRRQALDVLYRMCDESNGARIIAELLKLLSSTDDQIKDLMVLRIAILAEKFPSSFHWYFNTMCEVIFKAGDFCADEIWHRVVQLLSLQDSREWKGAVQTVFEFIQKDPCHELMIRLGAYLIGERGDSLCENSAVSPVHIMQSLHRNFAIVENSTKCILLTTYLKLVNLFPELRPVAMAIFEEYLTSLDLELQERACEYLELLKIQDDELLSVICAEMPAFSKKRSLLETKMLEKQKVKEGGELSPAPVKPTSNIPADALHETRPQAPSPINDLLSLEEPDYSPQPQMLPSGSYTWLTHFFQSNSGILYQDASIQLGVCSQISTGSERVQLLLYFGNLTGSATDRSAASTIGNVNITFSNCQEVQITCSAIPPTITAGTQERLAIDCTLHELPKAPVYMRIRYSSNPPVNSLSDITLRLPVLITMFAERINVTMEQFDQKWATLPISLRGTSGDEGKIISLGDKKQINIEWMKKALNDMKWGVVSSPNDRQILGCAKFPISPKFGVLFSLLRIECSNSNQVRDSH